METNTDMAGTNIKQNLDLTRLNVFPLGHDPKIKRLKIIKDLTIKEFAFDLWIWKKGKEKEGFICESIYREAYKDFLIENKYTRLKLGGESEVYILEDNHIITEVTISDMLRFTAEYIDSLKEEETIQHPYYGDIICRKITFKEIHNRQFNNIFNASFLHHLPENKNELLRDTENTSYLLFKNTIVEITPEAVKKIDYEDLEGKTVWKDHIKQRQFNYIKNNSQYGFGKFIWNVCDHDVARYEALKSAIGYLCHRYKPRTQAHAIILNDEQISENPEGGTGKTLIRQAIGQIRNVVEINGKEFNSKDQYKWNLITPTTQCVVIDDIKKNFNFEYLFSCLTGEWTVESKFRNKFIINAEDSPKVMITSNYAISRKGTSNLRRQLVYELGNYYSKQIVSGTEEPIKNDIGMLWGEDFTPEDWNLFDSFMIECIRQYLKSGLIAIAPKNVDQNYLIGQTTKDFAQFIYEDDFLMSKDKHKVEDVVKYYNENYGDLDDPFKASDIKKYFKKTSEKVFTFKRSNSIDYLYVNIQK